MSEIKVVKISRNWNSLGLHFMVREKEVQPEFLMSALGLLFGSFRYWEEKPTLSVQRQWVSSTITRDKQRSRAGSWWSQGLGSWPCCLCFRWTWSGRFCQNLMLPTVRKRSLKTLERCCPRLSSCLFHLFCFALLLQAHDSDLVLLASLPLSLLDSGLCWWISFSSHGSSACTVTPVRMVGPACFHYCFKRVRSWSCLLNNVYVHLCKSWQQP